MEPSSAAQINLKLTLDRISEAISLNKDLNTPNNLRWPCSICNKNVLTGQKGIQCDACDKWCHIKCDGTTDETYNYLMSTNDTVSWNCLYCTIRLF